MIGLTFLMQYAQGADDLFNLTNKAFGVFLPPIAIPMLADVLVKKVSKRSDTLALTVGIVSGVILFVVGGTYPFFREMVWMFPLTAVITIVMLAVCTCLFPDAPEEQAEIEAFHERIKQ